MAAEHQLRLSEHVYKVTHIITFPCLLLGTLAKLRKATISFVISVRLSVRMDFHEI